MGALQATDYFLWALQRFYEKGEDRYLSYLWPLFRLVRDLDDTRRHPYGEYYTQKKTAHAGGRKKFIRDIGASGLCPSLTRHVAEFCP